MKSDGARLIGVRVHIVVANVGRDARRIAVFAAEQESAAFADAAAPTAQIKYDRGPSPDGILIVVIAKSDPNVISRR